MTREGDRSDSKSKKKLVNLVKNITGVSNIRGLGDSTKCYYNALPSLADNSFPGSLIDKTKFKRQLKQSSFSANTVNNLFTAMLPWIAASPGVAETLLERVVPTITASISLLRAENNSENLQYFLAQLASQAGKGQIKIFSALCPPYTYVRTKCGDARHGSGQLLNTIGPRFPSVINTLGFIFAPLANAGVKIQWEFWTYSGESKNINHLIDIGKFVAQHYHKKNADLFCTLKTVFDDMASQSVEILGKNCIYAKACSLDLHWGKSIFDISEEYKKIFPEQFDKITNKNKVSNWVKSAGGNVELLDYFIEEEYVYRRNLTRCGINLSEPLIPAAIRECWLYILLIDYVKTNDFIIVAPEATSGYLMTSVDCFGPPAIMLRKDNSAETEKENLTRNLRQPYNSPRSKKPST